jgi:CubicO group peptidase (beta-lactamase class C family)
MYVPALSLLMFATSAAGQPAITRPDGGKLTPAKIDSTVDRLVQAAHVTGAGVALFHRGKIVYLNAYGLRDTEKGLPLTPDSRSSLRVIDLPVTRGLSVARKFEKHVIDCTRVRQVLAE